MGKKSQKLNFHFTKVEIEHEVVKELTPLIKMDQGGHWERAQRTQRHIKSFNFYVQSTVLMQLQMLGTPEPQMLGTPEPQMLGTPEPQMLGTLQATQPPSSTATQVKILHDFFVLC